MCISIKQVPCILCNSCRARCTPGAQKMMHGVAGGPQTQRRRLGVIEESCSRDPLAWEARGWKVDQKVP